MAEIIPRGILRVYDSIPEALGAVLYPGESLTYDLPGLMGTPGASYSGFDRDPTGAYLMQQKVPVPQDADPSQWQNAGGSAFSFGTDISTGKKFLRHTSAVGSFDVPLRSTRVLDEGFFAAFYVAAATASNAGVIPAVDFYIEFSRGRAQGEPGLRLALEPGKAIRLQVSLDDDATWSDAATADALGDCESYLDSNGRFLYISVLPMTDASWYAGLPATLDGSGAPPNQIVVTIGSGDAVLTYTDDGLAEGVMAVTGQNRQWDCRLALMRFGTAGSVTLAPQFRPAEFQSDPDVFLNGYAPDGGAALSGQVIIDSLNSAHVEMTLAAAPDATGYALRSCFLASVDAEFPPVQIAPSVSPGYVDYPLVFGKVIKSWDQTCGTWRHNADVLLTNQSDEFAPGSGAALGVRAASVFLSNGCNNFPPGAITEEIDGVLYALEMTGYTAMEENGQEWIQEGNLKFFRLSVSDMFVHTEADTAISCGFQLPGDYQSQYYVYGQQAYRLGIPDCRWSFPVVRRNQSVPGYYLDGGTTKNPVHRFPPDMTLGQSMEHVRAAGAEFDPVTDTPLPMVQGTDAAGNLLFFGLPVGVVSLLSNPALTLDEVPGVQPALTLSAVPEFNADGSAQLNEFVQSWSTKSSLRRVRTPIVMVGIDPQTGSTIFGVAYNEKLGGGRYADQNAPGYIGVDKPLYIISRLYSSQAVVDLAVQNAGVQLAAPAIDSGGQLHLQPGLTVLTVIAINDYASQGTTSDVGYYVTHVESMIDLRDTKNIKESTHISGRILGLTA